MHLLKYARDTLLVVNTPRFLCFSEEGAGGRETETSGVISRFVNVIYRVRYFYIRYVGRIFSRASS